MSDRLDRIRARRDSIENGYPVHVGCGGECVNSRCYGCDRRVSSQDVATAPISDAQYVLDVTYLLSELERVSCG